MPNLSKTSNCALAPSPAIMFRNSSRIRSPGTLLIKAAWVLIFIAVSGSITNPSCAAKRTALSNRPGSAINIECEVDRIFLLNKSCNPFSGSRMKPRHSGFWQSRMFNAIESTVKSRVIRLAVISPENSDKSIVRGGVDSS